MTVAPRIVHDRALAITFEGTSNDYLLHRGYDTFLATGTGLGWTITGFAGGWPGRRVTIIAKGGVNTTVNDADAGSAASNRVNMTGAANVSLNDYDRLDLVYDGVAGVWAGTPHT